MPAPTTDTSSNVIAIVGPTASGKTPLGLMVAERLAGEIVSADSRQIYRSMDIGTAKPPVAELRRIPHHLIDIRDPSEEYSAGEYMRDARSVIAALLGKGKMPVLVGGSGLYVRAAVDGLSEAPSRDPELRLQLENRLRDGGAAALWDLLRSVDPETAERTDPSKTRRIIRALEVYSSAGRPLSQLHKERHVPPAFRTFQYALGWNRSVLYGMIEHRVDRMMESGFLEEVKKLRAKGYGLHHQAMNTVGYRELMQYLEGTLTLSEATALIKGNSRRFAKRQLTWFRADKRIEWVAVEKMEDLGSIADRIVSNFRSVVADGGR